MRRNINNRLAEWAAALRTQPDGSELSYRQIENRTGVHYSTVKNIIEGRAVNAGDVILFAQGFGQDVPTALRIAEYPEIAEIWETGAAPQQFDDQADPQADDSEGPVISTYYDGLSPASKTAADQIIRALWEQDQRAETTHGRKAE
jgi:hypothetical protein